MKKFLSLVLAVVLACTALPCMASAETTASGTCGDDLTWTLEDGTLTISGNGNMEEWTSSSKVPWWNYRSEITKVIIEDGVTYIGRNAFWDCDSLTKITIPDSVTSIGTFAFGSCNSLTNITIPNSVINIGTYAFYGCTSLANITIPNSVISINGGTFYGCTNLTSIKISKSVTSISSSAFENCCNLLINVDEDNAYYSSIDGVLFNKEQTTLITYAKDEIVPEYTIPSSVTNIGDYAFYHCSSLTSITIPNSVSIIGDYAFCDCDSLTSITIPNSVTSIGVSAFGNLNLSISVNKNNAYYSSIDGVLFNKDATELIAYAKSDIASEYVIPDGVVSIGDYAFYGSYLTSITIPDGVTNIGDYAFYRSSIYYITIPDSVTSIGEAAFAYCYSLREITIPNNVTSIGEESFFSCTRLTSVIIENGLTSIASDAFDYCTSLTSVTIPKSVTTIYTLAFYDCTSLSDVYYNGSEDDWNNMSIYGGNSALTKATIHYNPTADGATSGTCGNGLTWSFDDGTLTISGSGTMTDYSASTNMPWNGYKSEITEIVIEDGVTNIGRYSFSDCTSLTSVTISDSVTTINGYAFCNCTSLANIDIPGRVATIVGSAFYGCTGLTSITIPNSVKSILASAFYNCTSLTSIIIPEKVTSIGNYAFYNCTSLTDVYYSGSEDDWNNIYMGTNNTSLTNADIHYNTAPTSGSCGNNLSWTFEDGTLTISGSGNMTEYSIGRAPWYHYVSEITKVIIEDGAESIGSYAFYDCTGLTDITIPDSVTSIGDYAFLYCESLASIPIPNNVTYLGSYAFYGCTGLTNIVIPDGVTSIGDCTFCECTGLTSITIPNSVTSIGNDAFFRCESLTSINIPDSVTAIGKNAFGWCGNLLINVDENNAYYSSVDGVLFNKTQNKLIAYAKDVISPVYTIPIGVTSIGSYAFSQCTNLTSLIIPITVTSIGESAFWGCTSKTDVYYGGSEDDLSGIANSGLSSVSVHYNATGTAAPQITDARITDNTVEIDLADTEYDSTLITVFTQDGTFADSQADTISAGDTSKTVDIADNADTVKVFIWDSLNGMKPLCDAKTVTIE